MMQVDLGGPVSTSSFNESVTLTVRLQLQKLLWQVKGMKIITLQKILNPIPVFRSVIGAERDRMKPDVLQLSDWKATSHMSYTNLCSGDAQITDRCLKKNERENETKAHVLQSRGVVMICVFLLSAVFMKIAVCHLPSSIYTL